MAFNPMVSLIFAHALLDPRLKSPVEMLPHQKFGGLKALGAPPAEHRVLTKRFVGHCRNGFAEADQLRQLDTRPLGPRPLCSGMLRASGGAAWWSKAWAALQRRP